MSEPCLVDLQPQAGIFLESIRNVGYSFETALADIVDNSLSAEARHVDIIAAYETVDKRPALCVQDDGWGMSHDELVQAMQFAHRDIQLQRAPNDLGRFGLGMKLASLSQARCLVVVSKRADGASTAAVWDIDYVRKSSSWSLKVYQGESGLSDLREFLKSYQFDDVFDDWSTAAASGTLVFWLGVDRFPLSLVDSRLMEVRGHLSLVFHRFLSSGVRIAVNGSALKATDPYLSTHPKSKPPQPLALKGLSVAAHVLPYMTELDDSDWKQLGITASQKSNTLKSGFYIYRAKRLIVWGRWFGLVPGCPSKKIVRVELDIGTDTDAEWQLDVRKSKAQIPVRFNRFILSSIQQALDSSQRTFVYASRGQAAAGVSPTWILEDGSSSGDWALRINRSSALYEQLCSQLPEEAGRLLSRFVDRLEADFPYEAVYARYQLQELNGGNHA